MESSDEQFDFVLDNGVRGILSRLPDSRLITMAERAPFYNEAAGLILWGSHL